MTLKNGSSSTDVIINTNDELLGEYNLILESFDSTYNTLVLMTDTIKIVIAPPPKGFSETLAYFVTELEQKSLISGKSEEWTLPQI